MTPSSGRSRSRAGSLTSPLSTEAMGDMMEYCKPGPDSTVRVFRLKDSPWDTQWTCEAFGRSYQCKKPGDMIDHLLMHVRLGHKVPRRVIDQLAVERDVVKLGRA